MCNLFDADRIDRSGFGRYRCRTCCVARCGSRGGGFRRLRCLWCRVVEVRRSDYRRRLVANTLSCGRR